MDLEYLSLAQYANLPDADCTYLIDRFLPCPGRVLLVGPPKKGKSYLALQIGLAVARGDAFLGRPAIPGGRRVLYLQFDTPHALWLERMRQLKEEGIVLPEYRPNNETGDFVVLEPSHTRPHLDVVDNTDDVAYLQQMMLDLKPSLVVVDTLAKLHGADENKADAMKGVFHVLNDIFKDAGLLYVHHTHKLTPPPGQKATHRPSPSDAARGSSFMAGEVDAIWLLYNHALTTEVRFDENGAYPCTQDPHTHFWTFPEHERLLKLEIELRATFALQSWDGWPSFRRHVASVKAHVPDHLMLRLRRELEPQLVSGLQSPVAVTGALPASSDATDVPSLPGSTPASSIRSPVAVSP